MPTREQTREQTNQASATCSAHMYIKERTYYLDINNPQSKILQNIAAPLT